MPKLHALAAATVALLSLAIGATSASAQQKAPKGNRGTLLVAWEETAKDKNYTSIYFRNDFPLDIIVDTVELSSCTGTRESCDAHQVDVKIPSGQIVEVMQVHSTRPGKAASFRFSFSAGSRRTAPDSPRLLGREAPDSIPVVPVEEIPPLVDATTSPPRCTRSPDADQAPGQRRLSVWFPSPSQGVSRAVSVWFDPEGKALRYTDRRGPMQIVWATLPSSGGGLIRSSTTPPGRNSEVDLDLERQTGTITLTDPEWRERVVRVAGPEILTAKSLNNPAEVISWAWKHCR